MGDLDISVYTLPNDQPFVDLDCTTAFNGLSNKEKLYAHYLSQASWYGGLIVYVQTSPESPLIFSLLHRLLSAESIEDFKNRAMKEAEASAEDVQALLVYCGGVFANSGNYKGFGDSKIVPSLSSDSLDRIIKTSLAYKHEPIVVQAVWDACKARMYSLEPNHRSLGLSDKGVTTYFTPNCSKSDSELVADFMKSKKLEAYNNRVFKYEEGGKTVYEIRMASVLEKPGSEPFEVPESSFKGCTFRVTRGDYGPILDLVVQNLKKAKDYTSNDVEKDMLDQYIESFTTGSLDAHKNGSRFWIKNKGPVIETYIGFIETYRDPTGMRGEFEGMVAMVNKDMSAKFTTLVNQAEELIEKLPWPKDFEKDAFLKPDFTSLDVLTFSGSIVPAGINIPNYDEIRQNEGFKNVSLGNVIPASHKDKKTAFLTEEDQELSHKFAVAAFEAQVGLHELLGHGSGKLFRKDEKGEFNFDIDNVINPLTKKKITSWYDVGDTYDSKFSTIGSSYEECRAESVALYLSLAEGVLQIFGFEDEQVSDVQYVIWLQMCWAGLAKALEMYQPSTKTWLQAHAQARYVILRVCLEAGENFVNVTETEEGKNLLLTLDRSKIDTVGKKAIGDFLQKLQVYKSTGDIESAKAMYDNYSDVPEDGPHPFAKWRSIIMAHKQPRKILVQHNTKLNGGNVELIKYPATPEGYAQSWIERFPSADVDKILETLWEKDAKHFCDGSPDKLAAAC